MNATHLRPASERGIALVTVLLMLAVLSGLATGFAMNGQTEAAMAANEVYYAGARAAAEAGMNRAIEVVVNNTTMNLLAGADQLTSATPGDAVNNDNGDISFLFASAGPYALDALGEYSYTIEVLDDDDPELYQVALTAAQLTAMGEDGDPNTNLNDRLILRVTGFGPRNTIIRVMRELQSVDTSTLTETTTTALSNPAILVNGDLVLAGNAKIHGPEGNVHTNGNLQTDGVPSVHGDATATGTLTSNPASWSSGGSFGGGRDAITVPDVQASDYLGHADYILTAAGTITTPDGTICSTAACTGSGWSYNAGTSTWTLSGNKTSTGTYYAQGNVTISGSPPGGPPGTTPIAVSVIATGSIDISGNPKFKPENSAKIMFVTDKDMKITGNVNLDPNQVDEDNIEIEGQILVREQLFFEGTGKFQGRMIVQDVDSTDSLVTANRIAGNLTVTYNGSLSEIETTVTTSSGGATTYVNNVRGWIEQ